MGTSDVVTSLIVGGGDDYGAEFGGRAEKACHGDNEILREIKAAMICCSAIVQGYWLLLKLEFVLAVIQKKR